MSDDGETQPVTQDQFSQLMEAISASESQMADRFQQFQVKVRQGQEDVAAKSLKRAKYDKPYTLKCRGNEEQSNFNARVDESLVEAEDELASLAAASTTSAPVVQKARDAVQKGRSLITDRQKLIRLADRSDHG